MILFQAGCAFFHGRISKFMLISLLFDSRGARFTQSILTKLLTQIENKLTNTRRAYLRALFLRTVQFDSIVNLHWLAAEEKRVSIEKLGGFVVANKPVKILDPKERPLEKIE